MLHEWSPLKWQGDRSAMQPAHEHSGSFSALHESICTCSRSSQEWTEPEDAGDRVRKIEGEKVVPESPAHPIRSLSLSFCTLGGRST